MWILGDAHARANDYGLFQSEGKTSLSGMNVSWNETTDYDSDDINIEKNHYWNPYQGGHKNGSSFNWIYTKKSVFASIDSSEMPNDGFWPFAHQQGVNEYHYFRLNNRGDYWYFDFNNNYWLNKN